MRNILLAGVFAALAAAAEGALNCSQCDSSVNSCANISPSLCSGVDEHSCISSRVNYFVGGAAMLYQRMFCSSQNCTGHVNTFVAFSVHVSDDQHLDFASQCCQGEACNDTHQALDPPGQEVSNNTECPACVGSNITSCVEKPRKCYEGERCISLFATFVNMTERKDLVLKGCSNISDSTCQFLSVTNQTVGEVVFRSVDCALASTSQPTSPPTTNANTSFRASLASWALASLLLGLLL